MAFTLENVGMQRVGVLGLPANNIDFNGQNQVTYQVPLNVGSLFTAAGDVQATDNDADDFIERTETIGFNRDGGLANTLSDPLVTAPNLTGATVVGVGQLGGLVTGSLVQYPVILVRGTSGGTFLIYPDGAPGLLTQITGTVNATLTLYADATVDQSGVFVPCFTRGTMITTDRGQVAVEDLQQGDMVWTADNGMQPIRWIGSRVVGSVELNLTPELRPIRIRRGALGANTPERDLTVSPQHRVLVRSGIAQKMFGTDEVLVAAKQLCQLDGIDIVRDDAEVEYFHMLFERHEVVLSDGALTETLFTGPEALRSIGAAALEEVFALFPELRDMDYTAVSARPLASGRMGRKLAVRHARNDKPLVM